jgi:(S)-2-hydroxy-acid oxidase
MDKTKFTIDCTGDVVVGDTILFTETVWGGNYKSPINEGERTIIAEVVKDSYGEKKQQHTFSLKVLSSYGSKPLREKIITRRKGRNVYRNGTKRLPWECRKARTLALNEKHSRGNVAREARKIRIETN